MVEKESIKKTGNINVYGVINDQCVWSRAGLAKLVKCMNAFDCLGCTFDQKVRADFEAREQGDQNRDSDPQAVRMYMLMNHLKCRHMLSGRVTYKLCGHGYNCAKCPYDQMIEDTAFMPTLSDPGCDHISGFDVARDYYFHHRHSWARIEYGGRVRVGMDDFAMRMLGPQNAIKLPKLGETVHQSLPQVELHRDDHCARAQSPIDGKVLAVNPRIGSSPESANQSPYGEGWMMVIQPTNLRKNLKNLLYGKESIAWMDDESTRLATLVSEESGYPLAATGGEALRDIYGSIPRLDWNRLVETFLT